MNRTHDMSHTRQYKVWEGMKDRCNPINKDYKRYGGRGITIDPLWVNFFFRFWEDMKNTYKDGLSIDRVDNDKGYCKENCKWSTPKQQCNNRRSNVWCEYKGEKLTLAQLSDKFGIERHLLYDRYSVMKWTIEKCIETSKQKRKTK